MSDGRALARAYLEQQRLLGTDAVVLPTAAGEIVAPPGLTPGLHPRSGEPPPGADSARSSPPTPRATPLPGEVQQAPDSSSGKAPQPDSDDEPRTTPSAGTEKAPFELPPPGLSYDPPAQDLFSTDPLQRAMSLADVATLVAGCTKCRLCDGRTNTVPGEGPDDARLVVVGEGPGKTEDETGRPFVGQAGELLTKILAAIRFKREQVYICNVIKCRPPQNRTPLYDEIASCVPYLFRQLEILQPKVVLAMGNTAAQTLLDTKQSLGALRGKLHRFRGIPVIVTYHPAALLRNPNWKKPTWDDVRIAHRLLDG